ncbi:MAG: hypothetical protein K9J17_04895 [Flavobacteriales bacterium]|nr:hypothetical protein [Flavobacteriales bacterium]
MTNKQERLVYLMMAMNAVLFVLIYSIISSNYRLAADDFHYLIKTKELGVWDSMLFYYKHWNPRWSATLITNFVLKNLHSNLGLFVYHLCSLVFGYVAIWSFVSTIINQLSLPFTKFQKALLPIYLLSGLFYSSFSKDDTWFWITVNPMYLWGTFSALLGGSFIIQKWATALRLPLVALLFLYAGGASETVAIATIIGLFYLGFITHQKHYLIRVDRAALHIATIACLVGFGTDIAGSGTMVRLEHLPQFTLGEKVMIGFWNYFKFSLMEIPLTLPFVVITIVPFAFFGRRQLRFQLIAIQELLFTSRKLWALADLTIFSIAFALAFSTGNMGPHRAWLPISVIVLVVAVVFAYQLGTWLYIKLNGKLFHFAIITQIIALGYQCMMGYHQINITDQYAEAVDARMDRIQDSECNGDLMKLSPLPDSGWLTSAEISSDTVHFTNKHLGLYFDNCHQFVLEDTVTSSQ